MGRLTERQIRRILYHRRDKDGMLVAPTVLPPSRRGKKSKPPRFPRSMEEELRQLEPLRAHVSPKNYEAMIATIKERWKSGKRDGGAKPKQGH